VLQKSARPAAQLTDDIGRTSSTSGSNLSKGPYLDADMAVNEFDIFDSTDRLQISQPLCARVNIEPERTIELFDRPA
jgi:hypothetical protein